jgi:hypothetical protein
MTRFLLKPLPCFKKAIAFFIASLLFVRLSAQPVITTFSPLAGPPGTMVTITGTGFNAHPDSNIVYFGGIRTTATTSSNTQLTVKVPVGANTQLITVTSGGLTAYSLKPFDITFAKGGGLTGSSFTPAGTLPTDKIPYSLAAADIDADGKADLVVVNQSSPFSVAVYRNTSTPGNISFSAPGTIPASLGAYDVATGDLNGDGLLDLVVTNYNSDSITTYRNTSTPGTISFDKGIRYKAGGYPWGITIRDLNADGKPDIAFANQLGTLSIYTNATTGTDIQLSSRTDYSNTASGVGITTADVNGDGKPDVIAIGTHVFTAFINRTTPNAKVFLVNTPTVTTGDWPIWLEAGDLDEDGKPDVVVTVRTGTKDDGMSFFRNTSADTSINSVAFNRTFIPVATGVGRIVMSDLDGDGHLDIANTGNPFSVIRNASTPGTIRMDRPSATSNNSTGAAAADLDGDGRPDLVTFNQNANTLSIFRNTIEGPNVVSVSPDSAITGATILLHGTNFTGITAVKLGSAPATFTVLSDSLISAVISTGVISDSVEVVTPLRSGVLTGYHFLNAPFIKGLAPAYGMKGSVLTISGRNFKGATAVSFGGQPAAKFTVLSDTSISAMVGQGASGAVIVTSKNGNGSRTGFTYIVKGPLPAITSFSPLTGPTGTTVTINGANFNPNPASNIVFFGAAKATVLSATSTQLMVMAPSGATYQPLTVRTDYQTATAAQAFNLTFEGGGTITDSTFNGSVYASTGYYSEDLVVADLDGDGLNDAAISSYGPEKYFTIVRNTSSGNTLSLASPINYALPTSNTNVCTGDINSDGKPDLVVTCANGVYIFKNTSTPGNISFDTILLPTTDITSNPAIADFNNDGKPDLVFGYTQINKFSVYRNTGVNDFISFASPVNYTLHRSSLPIRTGDIDGDGKLDIIESNYEWNTISVFRNISSNDTISLAPAIEFASGGIAMDEAIGDLDGDGKPEILACYPNQDDHVISLYINTSTPGNIALTRHDIQTTIFASQISLGDVDGDGKPDVVNVGDGFTAFKNISTIGNVQMDTYHHYKIATSESLALADFSGDGKPDVVATGTYESRVYVVQNTTGKNLDPVITSFTPAIAATGDTVFIKGTRFSATTTVTLGGTPANFTFINDSLITAIVTNGSTGKLSITTPYGSITNDGFVYRAPLPVINDFQPQSGTTGDVMTISGSNFSSVTAVSLGNTTAASFSILSDSAISVVIGTGASGSVQLANLTDTISKAGFSYVAPPTPTLTSFSPASATTGMSVTLLGTNLDKTNQVYFGGTPAASFIINSDTSVTAVVSSGATGSIFINTAAGTASIPDFIFRQPAPVLTNFNPATAASGDSVTIRGHELFNVTQVTFGGRAAASFTALNDSTITAIVGQGSSGDVSVIANNITASLSGFTYKSFAPVITNFTPAAATGDKVIINGYYLSNVNSVNFGYVHADSFVVINDSAIIAIIGYGGTNSITVSTEQDTTTVSGFNYLTPVINSFTPASGRIGDTIRIYGSHLTGITGISFGGVAPAYEKNDSNVVTAVLGYGDSGTLTANYYGAQQVVGTFTFINSDPVITGFYPSTGTKYTTVIISGNFYQHVTNVTFGGYPATSFTADSTQISAVVGDGGTGAVAVITDYATVSRPGFTYITPSVQPVITGISPDHGGSGTVIHISGEQLDSTVAVYFGLVPAASFTIDSDSSITAVVGNGATGNVSVITPAGTIIYPNFIFISPKPVIISVTPPSGTTGSAIRISGINLDSTIAVSFGGIPATTFTIDTNYITAIVGSGASGEVSISTPYGIATFPGFIFADPAKNIDVYPNPVQNGTIAIRHPVSIKTSYIIITDLNGMQLLKLDVAAGETVTTITGLDLEAGMYQVMWTDKNKKLVQRIVVP